MGGGGDTDFEGRRVGSEDAVGRRHLVERSEDFLPRRKKGSEQRDQKRGIRKRVIHFCDRGASANGYEKRCGRRAGGAMGVAMGVAKGVCW